MIWTPFSRNHMILNPNLMQPRHHLFSSSVVHARLHTFTFSILPSLTASSCATTPAVRQLRYRPCPPQRWHFFFLQSVSQTAVRLNQTNFYPKTWSYGASKEHVKMTTKGWWKFCGRTLSNVSMECMAESVRPATYSNIRVNAPLWHSSNDRLATTSCTGLPQLYFKSDSIWFNNWNKSKLTWEASKQTFFWGKTLKFVASFGSWRSDAVESHGAFQGVTKSPSDRKRSRSISITFAEGKYSPDWLKIELKKR